MKKLCLLFLVISIFISLPSTALFASEPEVKVGDSFFLNGEEVHLVDEDVDAMKNQKDLVYLLKQVKGVPQLKPINHYSQPDIPFQSLKQIINKTQ